MMVVVTLTDCPPKLRGDMTKWLCEINTGVYVGKISSRVRDELWTRICENLSNGKATMVYSANNEQGFRYRVHHTTWIPVDFDGITLMKRPENNKNSEKGKGEQGYSKAAQFQKVRKMQVFRQRQEAEQGWIVADLETSGLSPQKDEIIEIGALHVVGYEIVDQLELLVKPEGSIPVQIQKLTGITQELVSNSGVSLTEAVEKFFQFIGTRKVVYHNAGFDRAFIRNACERCGKEFQEYGYVDTMVLAKQELEDVENYKLETLAHYFGWNGNQRHRALEDCKMTLFLYKKLTQTE